MGNCINSGTVNAYVADGVNVGANITKTKVELHVCVFIQSIINLYH